MSITATEKLQVGDLLKHLSRDGSIELKLVVELREASKAVEILLGTNFAIFGPAAFGAENAARHCSYRLTALASPDSKTAARYKSREETEYEQIGDQRCPLGEIPLAAKNMADASKSVIKAADYCSRHDPARSPRGSTAPTRL